MSTSLASKLAVAAALLLACGSVIQAQMTLPPKLRGPELKGPNLQQLQRGQKGYVLANCHLCHGPTLAEARGGGADLYNSTLVLADVGGDMIAPVVRAGLPFTQTAMPRYPDMSEAEMADIVAYVHFMRQELREKRAIAGTRELAGQVGAGRAYFFNNCASCHSGQSDLEKAVASKRDDELISAMIRPAPAAHAASVSAKGRADHLRLLEGYAPADLTNLLAYLRSSGGRLTTAHAQAMAPPPREIETRFEQRCSVCHGPGGNGIGDRAPALINSATVAARGDDGLRDAIRNGLPGGMPAFRFSDRELSEYVSLLKKRNPTP